MNVRFVLSLSLLPALGCDGSEVGVDRVGVQTRGDSWAELRSYTSQRRDDFVASAEEHLDRLAAAAERAAQDASVYAADELDDEVAALRAELDDLSDATGEAWSESRDDVVDGLERLQQIVDRER